MPYKARRNESDWDLLAPDDTVVESGRSLPIDESDPAAWAAIASGAQSNQRLGEALATLAVGIERTE